MSTLPAKKTIIAATLLAFSSVANAGWPALKIKVSGDIEDCKNAGRAAVSASGLDVKVKCKTPNGRKDLFCPANGNNCTIK